MVHRPTRRPTVLTIGGGFGGFESSRLLEKLLRPDDAELVLVSPIDHMLYSSLLPEVAAGITDPRDLAVSLHSALRRTQIILGSAESVDLAGREATIRMPSGALRRLEWERLLLCPGAVTRTFPTPGLARHALGFKTLAQAVHLRDHVLRQLAIADADSSQRMKRCTFVVVGAGYTGCELAGQMQLMTSQVIGRYRNLDRPDLHWVLVDAAASVMPDLGSRLAEHAIHALRRRGIEFRLATEVERITQDSVRLSDGEVIPTTTVVWTAGVTPDPLVAGLGAPLVHGRLAVAADLRVPPYPDVYAFGDAAAVPDLTRPGRLTAMTAQHAVRQGRCAARNVAATLGRGSSRPYRHRNLGFVADLGGPDAVANPLGVQVAGPPAKLVTKGYHLIAIPAMGNRFRVLADWVLNLAAPHGVVELDFVDEKAALAVAPGDQGRTAERLARRGSA